MNVDQIVDTETTDTETTDTNIGIPATPEADTQDTATTQEIVQDYAKNIFNPDNRELDGAETTEESVETETPEEPDAIEAEEEADPNEVSQPVNIVFELDENGTKETIDVSTEDGRAKAEKYMKAGRYVERVRHEQIEKESSLNQFAQTLAYQTLYLQSQGKLNNADFLEKPYEFFIGKGETDEEDLKLWNDHKREVQNKIGKLNEFANNHTKTTQQFNQLAEKFAQSHPEITDVSKWIQENVKPYHDPIFTYGNTPYPEDTLENIYFAKNKDKIIKDAVDKALKDYVKKPVVKKMVTPQVRSNTSDKPLEDQLREHIRNTFGANREMAG